ncbi:diguanylate cyclase domain-containing protein [Methylobacterium sp. Leaf399]|uniref:diguanylate cyclase domain-containing protein n=1 Tax=Methylobacterium sp. Leaf399 TaxID=1736364 RepID=UPI000ABE7142|nr:diguanylate cyclase [Methylobacterium sp. Leaf399]
MHLVADNEAERLAAIRDLDLSALPPDPRLDAICRTAKALFHVPMCTITIVEADRQWFRAKCGVATEGSARDISFCTHTILDDAVLVIEDATADPRFVDNPLVTGPQGIRFYAGAPLVLQPGIRVGTMCVIDTIPRTFTQEDRERLQDLALIVVAQLRQAKIEAELRESEAHYRLLADNASDMIVWSNLDTTRRYVSPAAHSLLGFEPTELLGTRPMDGVHPDDAASYQRVLDDIGHARVKSAVSRQRYRRKDGKWVWVEATFNLTHDPVDGRPDGYVAAVRDIDERVEAERRIAHMARHDELTDVANRTLFQERLAQEIAHATRYGKHFAVFCLDLDRFKSVNDTLGHQAGDVVLRTVADRMRRLLRTEDTIARFGGDEFMVLQTRTRQPESSESLAKRLIKAVREPITVEGITVGVGLSIGIALGPKAGVDGDGLYRRADFALYRAKAGGRNTYRFDDDTPGAGDWPFAASA